MHDFEYVPNEEWEPVRDKLFDIIHNLQDEVRDEFTFKYHFVGSSKRKMITRDQNSNTGYDFDVNIKVNDDENNYSAKEIKQIIRAGFDKHSWKFNYDYSEDSKRVITIKVKDRTNSLILHSCDFAIVNDYVDDNGNERQEYIHFNKKQNTYEWQEQPEGFYMLPEKIEWIKSNGLWQEVRDRYLDNKNNNEDPNKKSRSIFAETIAQVYNEN